MSETMNFVIVCISCLKPTRHEALEYSNELVCDKCGAFL